MGIFDFVQNGGPFCTKFLRKITKSMKNYEKSRQSEVKWVKVTHFWYFCKGLVFLETPCIYIKKTLILTAKPLIKFPISNLREERSKLQKEEIK